MTIKEGRDVATILGVLRDSYGDGAMHNGVIYSLILLDKPWHSPVLWVMRRAKVTESTPACAALIKES